MSEQSEQPTHESLAAAVLAFQSEVPTIVKEATAKAGSFSYKYADIADVLKGIQPYLTKHGLVFQSYPCSLDGQPALRYKLTHAPTGDSDSEVMPLVLAKTDPQGFGSGVTYARRYSLGAVLNLVIDDDDDGHAATRRTGETHVQTAKQTLGAVELATSADVDELRKAAKGVRVVSIKEALRAVGVGEDSFHAVPRDKVVDLCKRLEAAPR